LQIGRGAKLYYLEREESDECAAFAGFAEIEWIIMGFIGKFILVGI
jgi:hypothetical protein